MVVVIPQTGMSQVKVGPAVGYDVDAEAAMLGGELGFGVSLSEDVTIMGNPSFSYYFIDGGSLVAVDFDGHYDFPIDGSVTPYAGAGLGLRRFSFDVPDDTNFPNSQIDDSHTDLVFNLLGGARFEVESAFEPFAEIKLSSGDGSTVGLLGGILFEI